MKSISFKNKIKKLVILMSICLLLILLTSFALIQSGKRSNIDDISKIDTVIVLGAGLWGDQVSPQLELRLITAYELLKANPDIIAVTSGGQGPDELVTEAKAMKDYLVNLGIDENRIIEEDMSTSTYENLKFSFDVLNKNNIEYNNPAIVTTNFHIYRAKMLSKRLGVNAEGLAAPNIRRIIVKNNIREVFALIKDYLFSR